MLSHRKSWIEMNIWIESKKIYQTSLLMSSYQREIETSRGQLRNSYNSTLHRVPPYLRLSNVLSAWPWLSDRRNRSGRPYVRTWFLGTSITVHCSKRQIILGDDQLRPKWSLSSGVRQAGYLRRLSPNLGYSSSETD